MTPNAFRKLALSLPDAHEEPHFERASFRVGKKIFATMVPDGSEAMVKVHPIARAQELIDAHPNVYFGYGGWTSRLGAMGVRLPVADASAVAELVRQAWQRIAPKRLSPRFAASSARSQTRGAKLR